MLDGDSYFEDTNSKQVMEVGIIEAALLLEEKLVTLKGFLRVGFVGYILGIPVYLMYLAKRMVFFKSSCLDPINWQHLLCSKCKLNIMAT